MAMATIDETRLKDLLKAALLEAVEEHRDIVRDIVEEALEDIAMSRAIEQGLNSNVITPGEVFALLARKSLSTC